MANLEKSLRKYGIIDPAIINNHPDRKNVVIGGHMRIHVAKKMGLKEMPCVFVTIGDIEKEKELNPTLNKVQGDWDWDLLKGFSESLLTDVGFESEEIDDIFGFENEPENFDLDRELKKLCI